MLEIGILLFVDQINLVNWGILDNNKGCDNSGLNFLTIIGELDRSDSHEILSLFNILVVIINCF